MAGGVEPNGEGIAWMWSELNDADLVGGEPSRGEPSCGSLHRTNIASRLWRSGARRREPRPGRAKYELHGTFSPEPNCGRARGGRGLRHLRQLRSQHCGRLEAILQRVRPRWASDNNAPLKGKDSRILLARLRRPRRLYHLPAKSIARIPLSSLLLYQLPTTDKTRRPPLCRPAEQRCGAAGLPARRARRPRKPTSRSTKPSACTTSPC